MDLQDLKPKSDTIEVLLVHPATFGDEEPKYLTDNEGNEFVIKVYATHTRKYKESQQKNLNKFFKDKKKELEIIDIEDAEVEHFARITESWNLVYGGKVPDLSEAESVYRDLFWIREQIKEALSTSEVFTLN